MEKAPVPNNIASIIYSFEKKFSNDNSLVLYSDADASLAVIFIEEENLFEVVGINDSRRGAKKNFESMDFIHPEDNSLISYSFLSQQKSELISLNIRLLKEGSLVTVAVAELEKIYFDSANKTIVFKAVLHTTKSLLTKNVLDQAHKNSFSSMLSNSLDFIYFKDLHHAFTASSQTMANITGFSSGDEHIGLTDYDIFPKEHADVYYRLEKEILEGIKASTKQLEPYYDVNGDEG